MCTSNGLSQVILRQLHSDRDPCYLLPDLNRIWERAEAAEAAKAAEATKKADGQRNLQEDTECCGIHRAELCSLKVRCSQMTSSY